MSAPGPLTVAIVGRPNVGKSTLFNRLVGRRVALVDDRPGVTRDRREGDAALLDLRFRIVDTAGLDEAEADSLEDRMRAQSMAAVDAADLALFLVDARAGVTPMDRHFAQFLRKASTPIVLVANKAEGKGGEAGSLEAYELGLGEPVAISAEHGVGMPDLRDAMVEARPALAAEEDPEDAFAELVEARPLDLPPDGEETAAAFDEGAPLQFAIVGRPNVGKSTLVNALLGQERLLTGPEAGITRDAIAVDWTVEGRSVRLIDTAGVRRRTRVTEKLEKLSVAETRRAIRFAHVVVLVLDANDMLEHQDLTIAKHVIDEGRAMVIAANKWDAVEDREDALDRLRDRVRASLPQVKGIPCVTVSAVNGRNLDRLMQAVLWVYDIWNRRVPTHALNQWLADMVEAHPPPAVRGRRIKMRYMTQARIRPPTFALFCSRPDVLPETYLRYLENGLRQDFDLTAVPIRINLRKGRNPYAPDTRGGG